MKQIFIYLYTLNIISYVSVAYTEYPQPILFEI